jgi:hypothetical protein
MSNIESIIRKEISLEREIYTNLSPTKRVKLLEIYPVHGRYEVIVEIVESEFSSDGVGSRLTMSGEDVIRILGINY